MSQSFCLTDREIAGDVTPRAPRKRREIRKLRPVEIEYLLKEQSIIQSWGREAIRDEQRRIRGQKRRLRQLVCSEQWFEANWEGAWMIIEDRKTGDRVCKLVPAPYPPGGDQTLMQPCHSERCSGRLYPPQYIGSHGYCKCCEMIDLHLSSIQREIRAAGIELTASPGVFIRMAAVKSAHQRGENYRSH